MSCLKVRLTGVFLSTFRFLLSLLYLIGVARYFDNMQSNKLKVDDEALNNIKILFLKRTCNWSPYCKICKQWTYMKIRWYIGSLIDNFWLQKGGKQKRTNLVIGPRRGPIPLFPEGGLSKMYITCSTCSSVAVHIPQANIFQLQVRYWESAINSILKIWST